MVDGCTGRLGSHRVGDGGRDLRGFVLFHGVKGTETILESGRSPIFLVDEAR